MPSLHTSTAEVSRWLKSKESPLVHCLCFTDEGGQVRRTASVVEGAQTIYDYWKNFWRRLDRTRPALQARTAALLATVPSPETAVVFPLPQADALQRRARRMMGGSGLSSSACLCLCLRPSLSSLMFGSLRVPCLPSLLRPV